MSFTLIPKNDAQLNELISNLNNAYGAYFDFKISDKRSNKLRDCICEGLGFKNGAYQQLQKYWESHMTYRWSDKNFIVGLKSSLEEGRFIGVFAPSFLSKSLIEKINIQYPAGDKNLLGEDDAEGVTQSWSIDTLDSNDEKNMNDHKEFTGFYPVFYSNLLVGHTFEPKYASLLNAIFCSMSFDSDVDIINNRNEAMLESDHHFDFYLNQTDGVKTPYGKYISLRMESMPHSIFVPFDSIEFNFNSAVLKKGNTKEVISYDRETDMVIWNGMSFEFLSVYNMNHVLDKKTVTMEVSGKEIEVEYFEWYPENNIEFRLPDEDDVEGAYLSPKDSYILK